MLKHGFLAFVLVSSSCATITKLIEYTCFSYTAVDDVKGLTTVTCAGLEVFDPHSKRCIKPTQGHWPCGDVKDCKNQPNHRYVDHVNDADPAKRCKTYYTCQNGYFYGHNYCPGDTVYNEKAQLCDWITNVDPPCGTFGVTLAPLG